MRGLGSLISLLVVALIVAFVYKFYFSQQSAETGAATPVQTIDIVGVKNDLVAIAQSERIYQAQHGSYASLDDLVSSGAMNMAKPGRDGYTYEAETSESGFRIVAHCPTATSPGCSNYAIDQTMEVQAVP
jgi:hypothetical protein